MQIRSEFELKHFDVYISGLGSSCIDSISYTKKEVTLDLSNSDQFIICINLWFKSSLFKAISNTQALSA